MEEYKKNHGDNDSLAKEATPAKRKADNSKQGTPAKHARSAAKDQPKRGTGKKSVSEPVGVPLSDAVLADARKAGYESELKNLAVRTEVVASGKSDMQLLASLKNSNGIVNAAKRALLGA